MVTPPLLQPYSSYTQTLSVVYLSSICSLVEAWIGAKYRSWAIGRVTTDRVNRTIFPELVHEGTVLLACCIPIYSLLEYSKVVDPRFLAVEEAIVAFRPLDQPDGRRIVQPYHTFTSLLHHTA